MREGDLEDSGEQVSAATNGAQREANGSDSIPESEHVGVKSVPMDVGAAPSLEGKVLPGHHSSELVDHRPHQQCLQRRDFDATRAELQDALVMKTRRALVLDTPPPLGQGLGPGDDITLRVGGPSPILQKVDTEGRFKTVANHEQARNSNCGQAIPLLPFLRPPDDLDFHGERRYVAKVSGLFPPS